ncbi:disease resistance protein RPV1-like isoform X14 [Malus sylvestris]|uniref:disease resistance protein RPV1-like isoform X14 n=1 Tax=Malus sylvestris TaxID=3752 RepID=UPI0021ABFCD8|nr:disease resistance protein RPV1-like isoform X14 [Malus sylvestris]
MAAQGASSSSSSSKLWKYDVFLSFRGEDTRKGFTGHLRTALEEKGYKTFIDEDDLKRGEEIKPELLRAIEESRISIIVFSKRYADSSWCLNELVKIMECRSKLEQHVLPIFYDVEASDIRKQEGSLAPMFQKHEENICKEEDGKKGEAKRERVKQWREALTEAANLSGYDLKNTENGHETKLIKKIIYENLWKWLPRTKKLHVAKFPVGINSRVQEIITYLSSGEGNKILMVGIWGMGGLGKTTVAKAIYNQIHHEFEFKSFLADVSDTTSKHGLVHLQKKLSFDIMDQEITISTVDEGICRIEEQFSHRKVLVIMDNIDGVEQLNAIAGNRKWFGPGSRIIITTRDKHLLIKVDKVYQAQILTKGEALELFSWHAFGNSYPNEEYLEVSKKVVSYCGGLPLALEVLGSFLCERPQKVWNSQLEKLERTPDGKIIKPLRMSFDGLDDTEKATFLNISCFFIGEDEDRVAKLLDVCGFSATVGINVLCERCLVTVEGNKLNMHDLLREMARIIISDKSPGDPGKWSRLWSREDVTNVLTYQSGTEEVEGLALHLPYGYDNASFSTEAFANMKKLRLLHLKNVRLNGEYKHLPKELIWFRWKLCPLKSIRDDFFNQPRLVVLEMQWSKLVQVWEGSKSLHNLKTLDLSYSRSLQKSPDFSQVPNLEELILEGCESLTEIHPSIGHLKRLSLVNLSGCHYKLISLPRDFYKLKSIETLLLNYCRKFRELHEDIGEMISLRTLEAKQTDIREVPPSIVRLKNLTRLSLDRISVELKGEYKHLPKELIRLRWDLCPLKSIPDDFFNQDKLVVLEMQWSELVQVWEGSKKSPDFSQAPNLEDLILEGCWSLFEIHPSIGHLKRLSLVNLRRCDNLCSLPRDFYKSKSVENLLLNRCSKFREVHEDIGEMISLRTLEAEQTNIREVPPSIVRLKNLTRLSLSDVESIHLPHSLHGLNSLRELHLSRCRLADDEIPKDLGSLISLQVLDLSGNDFYTLPSLSGLSKLETLQLDKCFNLRTIPDIPPDMKVQHVILPDSLRLQAWISY